MKAVILVGGFGTRLRPLTFETPKPLLPIANVRILEHILASLGRAGIGDAVLALGFKPEPFRAAFPDGTCAGVRLEYAVEPRPLDTAGAIGFAARHAGIDDTFVVLNGDILTDLDIASLVAFHRAHGLEGTIHLTGVEDPSQFGVVESDSTGRVTRFLEKPGPDETESRSINGGTYVLEASVIERIPVDEPLSVERVVFPAMVAEGRLAAMRTDDYWIDTGRPDTYLRANLDMIDGSRSTILASVAARAAIDPAAVVSRAVIGDHCTVGAGAIVTDSVLLSGAEVAASARVESCIVAGSVGAGANVRGCIIGSTGSVAPGSDLVDVRIPDPDSTGG